MISRRSPPLEFSQLFCRLDRPVKLNLDVPVRNREMGHSEASESGPTGGGGGALCKGCDNFL
jgi:hypothetical protein